MVDIFKRGWYFGEEGDDVLKWGDDIWKWGVNIARKGHDKSQHGGEKHSCAAFCRNLFKVPQGMSIEFFAHKIEDMTFLSMLNIMQNLARKLDITLKPSHLNKKRIALILKRKSSNAHAIFEL